MKTVALAGRANVGKSSLFNALLGYRRAIVFDEPGTTRDAVLERVDWDGESFQLMDSEGLDEGLPEADILRVLSKPDVFVFVVDASVGVVPHDRWLASRIRETGKPVLVCVNKIESPKASPEFEFAELGLGECIGVSAAHRLNIESLKSWILEQVEEPDTEANSPLAKKIQEMFPESKMDLGDDGEEEGDPDAEEEVDETKPLRLALIGRPNTGKSTLMNRLCGETVSRVSPVALTTRDPVSFEFEAPQGVVQLVDTAGIRRPRSEKTQVEVFSVHAAQRAMRKANVVFLCLASHESVTDQDIRLLNLLVKEGKPAAVLLNFWDTISAGEQRKFFENCEFADYLESFRLLTISGKTGYNVEQLLPLAFRLRKKSQKRIKTSRFNKIVEDILRRNPPPSSGYRPVNILYASQVRTEPPSFVFFMNRRGKLAPSYRKYLENSLKDRLNLKGQPIRLFFRGESV